MTSESKIRDKLIRFARDRFFAEGFYRVTMDKLALDLRISKKTIYRLFPSKSQLVETAVFGYLEENSLVLEQIVQGRENSIGKLNAIMNFVPGVIRRLDKRFLDDLRVHMPDFWERVDVFRTRMLTELIGRIIRQGAAEGLVKEYPPELIVQMFIGSVRAVANPEFLTSTSLSYNEAMRMTIQMLIGAIATVKGNKIFVKILTGKNDG